MSIDDHNLFRSGIELIVKGAFPGATFRSHASLGLALEATRTSPDVLLLDLHLDGIGGHEAIPLIKLRWPDTAIIIVTSEQDRSEIERARRLSGGPVVLKSAPPEQFVNAIRSLAPRPVNPAGAEPPPLLSRRQLEVLQHLGEGHSNKIIAKRMDISEFTVRGHVQQLMKALGVPSRVQAVLHAQKLGLL